MNVELKLSPFPHILINDYFDEHQSQNVWNEIKLLYPKMVPPEETYAALDSNGRPKKRGIGLFLEDVYKNPLGHSDIVNYVKTTIFSPEFRDNINVAAHNNQSPEAFYFRLYNLVHPFSSSTVLQLYVNGDYYKGHTDHSLFTFVSVLHSEEKKYEGGELYFKEYDYTVNLENNQAIIFPSILLHEVKQLRMKSDDPLDGRFSISLLMPMHIATRENLEKK